MGSRVVQQEVVKFCHCIYKKGYAQTSEDDLSCRMPGTELVAIKKTTMNMRVMTDADVLIVDTEGNVVYGDDKPSKKADFHLGILKLRPGMGVFIHCHSNYSIVLTNNNIELPFVSITARKVVGHVSFIEPAPVDNEDLRRYVINAFRDRSEGGGILMEEHGVCVMGLSLEAVYNVVDLIEQAAKQAYIQVQAAVNRGKFRELFQM